jgi:MerR family transcriptional regulator, redox-sensitive transcriptional activator SoxR
MEPPPTPVLLTIGDIARRSGVAPSALRYYEDRGLIESRRAPSGHRRFDRAVFRRIAFIVFAQRVGLSLEEIHGALSTLPTDRVPTGEDWAGLTGPWVARIDERITELERLRHDLSACIGCGCLSLEACTLINPGDRAERYGPGPARWKGGSAPRRDFL